MHIGKILFWIIPSLILAVTIISLAHSWRVGKYITAVLCVLLLLFIGYHYYDNNRIVVKREYVLLENLPPVFEGFTILQVTDLHGKYFGHNQDYLAAQINALVYDMIAFTGDMETNSSTFGPFLELLEGIKKKDHMFYVNGNYDLAYDSLTGEKTEVGTMLERHGCILLTEPYPIKKDGNTLWLADVTTRPYRGYDVYAGVPALEFKTDEQYQAYQSRLVEFLKIYAAPEHDGTLRIGLTHIPFTKSDVEQGTPVLNTMHFDIVIAGHYHGGQIRIPFYGAPFIPVMTSSFDDGIFPDQKYVSGLVTGPRLQQYVSRGLGSSNIPFRLFNTPEINLLTLKAK